MSNILKYLQEREATLLEVCRQLVEQGEWADQNDKRDLARSYVAASRNTFAELHEVQRALAKFKVTEPSVAVSQVVFQEIDTDDTSVTLARGLFNTSKEAQDWASRVRSTFDGDWSYSSSNQWYLVDGTTITCSISEMVIGSPVIMSAALSVKLEDWS